MLILDREGRVQFLNEEAAAFLGRPAASLLGAAFPFALSAVNSNSEIHFEHADGSRRHAEMRVIETQWGTRPARIVSLSDISLRRQLEIALSRASLKERNRISARQSHTIQAAVSEIDKCAAIIRDAAAGPLDARYRSYAGKICDSSKEILASLDLPVDTIAPQDA
jgi:PAS domain-containing protein